MSEATPRDPNARGRYQDRGRVAKWADSPHMRFWPRLLIPVGLAILGWLIVDLIGGVRLDNMQTWEKLGDVQISVSNLSVQTAVIQGQYEVLSVAVSENRKMGRAIGVRVGRIEGRLSRRMMNYDELR